MKRPLGGHKLGAFFERSWQKSSVEELKLKRGEPTSAAALPHPRTARCPQRRRGASSSVAHTLTDFGRAAAQGWMARPRLIGERNMSNQRDHHDRAAEIGNLISW